MSVAVTHGRTATSIAARRAPPPKKRGERPNLRPRTADLYRWLLAERVGRRPVGNIEVHRYKANATDKRSLTRLTPKGR